MSEVDVFRHQVQAIHEVLRRNVAGLTHEESLIEPSPAGNCLNWVVGHLLCIYEKALSMLGQKTVMEEGALKRYDRGAPPLHDPAEALDFQKLLTAWDEATKRFDAGLAGLTAEALDRPAPRGPGSDGNETLRSVLAVLLFHQAYHTGQTGILRRIAGKEGAIP
jgi:uncharacterized damage-inducible protein DinB